MKTLSVSTHSEQPHHSLKASQNREHFCLWPGCDHQVLPTMWGCKKHWNLLPRKLRNLIWRYYRPGQEEDHRPSREYVHASELVQEWIVTHHPTTIPEGTLTLSGRI